MFTWEEAGLLRQMVHVVLWSAVCLVLAVTLVALRRPITSAVRSGYQRLTARTTVQAPAP